MKLSVKAKKRSAVSPVIATLLLIAIAVAAAIIVYAFVTGLIGGLTTTGGSSLVQVTGTLTVPSGSGLGTLVINVKNSANNPITVVTAASDSANGVLTFTSGGANYAPAAPFTVYANAAGLPIGQSTSGVATVGLGGGSLTAGNTYTFTVIVTFGAGSTQTQTLSVTAQV